MLSHPLKIQYLKISPTSIENLHKALPYLTVSPKGFQHHHNNKNQSLIKACRKSNGETLVL